MQCHKHAMPQTCNATMPQTCNATMPQTCNATNMQCHNATNMQCHASRIHCTCSTSRTPHTHIGNGLLHTYKQARLPGRPVQAPLHLGQRSKGARHCTGASTVHRQMPPRASEALCAQAWRPSSQTTKQPNLDWTAQLSSLLATSQRPLRTHEDELWTGVHRAERGLDLLLEQVRQLVGAVRAGNKWVKVSKPRP